MNLLGVQGGDVALRAIWNILGKEPYKPFVFGFPSSLPGRLPVWLVRPLEDSLAAQQKKEKKCQIFPRDASGSKPEHTHPSDPEAKTIELTHQFVDSPALIAASPPISACPACVPSGLRLAAEVSVSDSGCGIAEGRMQTL